MSRAALLAKLRRRLPACVTEAYLFGSYARDEASAESDIDLILVAPSSRTFPDRFRDVPGLGKGLPPMDLMIYTPAEWRTLRAQPSSLLQVAMSEWVAVISSAPAVPPPRRFRSG
ncbi:MAG: nucleotidyltransferase domain-containing protein [Deltaproteobacteria bacterium]|nr:nucleotidyltransferase domain-containing protein [Deltaproteobacteria bacterium]